MKKAMLIDTSKCMGCRGCQVACKQWNELPAEKTVFNGTYENPPRFSANTWTKIVFRELKKEDSNQHNDWLFTKMGCMHCTDAACMKSCPAGAISHTSYGTVMIDEKKCIGCNYCIANCPFDVMGFDRDTNVARKCTFCVERIAAGEIPACAKTCPTDAITFGNRSEIINLADRRLREVRNGSFPNADIYGVNELNGTGNIYLLKEGKDDAENKYGLPSDPVVPLSTEIWNFVFKPVRVVLVLAMGFAIWSNKNHSVKQNN